MRTINLVFSIKYNFWKKKRLHLVVQFSRYKKGAELFAWEMKLASRDQISTDVVWVHITLIALRKVWINLFLTIKKELNNQKSYLFSQK